MAFTSDGQENLTLSIPITKATEAEDGTLYVEGLCTDDGLDLDEQVIQKEFAVKGLTTWFSDWANVRAMHSSNIPPAGKAVDMDVRPEGVWIRTHVVEPTAIKLVKEGVYQAYSVGISKPRIIRDPQGIAKNGLVVDGIFSEVSLVDFPANPRAKFSLAKRAKSGEVEIVEKAVEVELTKAVPTPADVFGKGGPVGFDEGVQSLAKGGPFTAYDEGGMLPSGLTEVTNASGEPIAVEKRDIPTEMEDPKENVPQTPVEKASDSESTTPVESDVTKAGARDCPDCGKSHHADSSAKYCADCGKKLPAAKAEKSADAEVVAPEAEPQAGFGDDSDTLAAAAQGLGVTPDNRAGTPAPRAETEASRLREEQTQEVAPAETVEKSADLAAGPDPSAFTPGSSAWEAADAAKASEAVQGLIALRSSIRDLAAREQAEGDDQENVWNLNDAAFAVDNALAVLARFAATEQAEANDAAAAGKGLDADLTKSLDAVRAELVKFAPAAEVEALRADLTAEREARESLEKRFAELEKSPDPHNRAYRGAPLAALRPQAGEATAGRGDAGEPEVLKSIILKARKDITGPAAEQLKKAVGAKQAAALIFGEGE